MTLGMAKVSREELFARPGELSRANVGDTLLIGAGNGVPRIGEIIGVTTPDGSPPYRVRWLAGEYESVISPGPGARIVKGH